MADKTIPDFVFPPGGEKPDMGREDLAAVAEAVAALSPEDRELLAAVQSDEWNHERPAEPEKKPSIRERLEQGKKECAEKNKAQPHKEKAAPEL